LYLVWQVLADGKELSFLAPDREMMAVAIAAQGRH
jgi:hypothetical protein